MIKRLGSATLLALSLASCASTHEEESDVTHYRVFVADHKASQVVAFDLHNTDKRWEFDTAGQAKLYSVSNDSVVVAVQSFSDQVNFISSGISLEDHGEHSDIKIEAPQALRNTLKGPSPFHLLEHSGKVSINFDEGGYASIIDGDALANGQLKHFKIEQNIAHHGVVVPLGDQWLTSVASKAKQAEHTSAKRVGVQLIDATSQPIGELQACTDLHGEGFSGNYLAIGCKEGVLTVKHGRQGAEYMMLPYPASFPKGEMVGHFLGSKTIQVFLGSYGKKGLVVIDPVDEPHMQLIKLPFRRVDFIFDKLHPIHGYVLTEDGKLSLVNVLNANIEKSIQVTEPYSLDGHWNDPRPRLAIAGDEILVTDPNQGVIHRIKAETLTKGESIDVGGQPYNITVVGGSGMRH